MSQREQITLAYLALFLVMAVLVGAAWLMLGALTERHTWRYRLFQISTLLISLMVVGIGIYVWVGPGRPLVESLFN